MLGGRIIWERSMIDTPSDTPPGSTSRTAEKVKCCWHPSFKLMNFKLTQRNDGLNGSRTFSVY